MAKNGNQTGVIRLSKEMENAQDGAFDTAYSGNGKEGWFVKVKPAFGTGGAGIDHVVFSFVNKGSSGKDAFDIYIGIRKFRGWCLRIRSGAFFTDLEKEKARGEKYPVMYKVQTGEKGHKVLGFMLSSIPGMVAVNAKDKDHQYISIPLEYGFLENLAYDFLEMSKGRFAELLEETMTVANSYRASLSEDDKEYMQQSNEKGKPDEKPAAGDNLPEVVEIESFWAVPNGSILEQRGKDGTATMLRLVIPALADKEPGLLTNSPNYQLADCLFYINSVKKAGISDQFESILARIKTSKQVKIPSFKFKVGDIRDGYRQLIFMS